MANTYLELQNRTLRHGFSALRYREDVKAWLNDALGMLSRIARPPAVQKTQTFTTVAGQQAYELAVDYVRPRSEIPMRHLDDDPDSPVLAVKAAAVELQSEATGKPLWWALEGGEVLFGPTPDGEYRIALEYWGRFTRLSEDDDRTPLADEDDQALVEYALWHCYQREHDREFALHHQAQWDLLKLRYATDQRSQEATPRRVPGLLPRWAAADPELERP